MIIVFLIDIFVCLYLDVVVLIFSWVYLLFGGDGEGLFFFFGIIVMDVFGSNVWGL